MSRKNISFPLLIILFNYSFSSVSFFYYTIVIMTTKIRNLIKKIFFPSSSLNKKITNKSGKCLILLKC